MHREKTERHIEMIQTTIYTQTIYVDENKCLELYVVRVYTNSSVWLSEALFRCYCVCFLVHFNITC